MVYPPNTSLKKQFTGNSLKHEVSFNLQLNSLMMNQRNAPRKKKKKNEVWKLLMIKEKNST